MSKFAGVPCLVGLLNCNFFLLWVPYFTGALFYGRPILRMPYFMGALFYRSPELYVITCARNAPVIMCTSKNWRAPVKFTDQYIVFIGPKQRECLRQGIYCTNCNVF